MIRPATAEDILDFAPKMREADKEEVEAIIGLDPLAALSIGLFQSDQCCIGINPEGEVVGVFGVVPIVPNQIGSVWFLSSDAITRSARHVVREAREWLDEQNATYPILTNVVTDANTVHKRLLRSLGFTFGTPIENYGTGRVRVIPFERYP
ncbi:phage protein Gp13 family protein [Pseudovibrio ascidiaceicola]|uniref:phage protein Gp13 family protein n=1 Tax=Pseudovibrio ascidiaceicola TaxID=285279 RepID=UPI003D369919